LTNYSPSNAASLPPLLPLLPPPLLPTLALALALALALSYEKKVKMSNKVLANII
jgi:hypothetical protein